MICSGALVTTGHPACVSLLVAHITFGGKEKTATIQTRFPLSEVMLARSRLAGKNVQLPRLRPLHDTLLLHRRPAAGLPLDQANA